MSEQFWTQIFDNLIHSATTVLLAAIAASPVIILGWLRLRQELRQVDRHVSEAHQAAINANRTAVAAAERAAEAAEVSKDGKEELKVEIKAALDSQTAELKSAIKKNGSG